VLQNAGDQGFVILVRDVTWANFVFTRCHSEIYLIIQQLTSATIPALWDKPFVQRASENIIKLYIPSPYLFHCFLLQLQAKN
jgi:hypothetical protein